MHLDAGLHVGSAQGMRSAFLAETLLKISLPPIRNWEHAAVAKLPAKAWLAKSSNLPCRANGYGYGCNNASRQSSKVLFRMAEQAAHSI